MTSVVFSLGFSSTKESSSTNITKRRTALGQDEPPQDGESACVFTAGVGAPLRDLVAQFEGSGRLKRDGLDEDAGRILDGEHVDSSYQARAWFNLAR